MPRMVARLARSYGLFLSQEEGSTQEKRIPERRKLHIVSSIPIDLALEYFITEL